MKKALLLLALVCFISCTNNQQNNNTTDATDSVAVVIETVDVTEAPEVEDTEITLDFSSYHLYTSEDDKYDSYGYQPVSAKVTIDEENKKASLKLYDSGEKQWYPFNFRIDEKLHLQEGVITYTVYNNANQKGYIYVSTNRPGGLFVDINNFVFNGDVIFIMGLKIIIMGRSIYINNPAQKVKYNEEIFEIESVIEESSVISFVASILDFNSSQDNKISSEIYRYTSPYKVRF